MNAESYDRLPGEVSQKLAEAFRVPKTAAVARRVLTERLRELSASGELQRLSEEECQLLAEFRGFKAISRPGAVFKWQTRPDELIAIVESPEIALIRHPQNVSGETERRPITPDD